MGARDQSTPPGDEAINRRLIRLEEMCLFNEHANDDLGRQTEDLYARLAALESRVATLESRLRALASSVGTEEDHAPSDGEGS